MFFTLFVCLFVFENNAVGRRPLRCVVDRVTSTRHSVIASAFVCRFRWRLHRFFAEEKPFPAYISVYTVTVFKIVARWRYDWCPNGRKKLKI